MAAQEDVEARTRLSCLKQDLEGYREIILHLNKILEWEESHYPAALVAVITFVFSIVWYLEPSVLTSFSVLGVTMCMIDFAVPTLSGYLFKATEWTVIQERKFENVCIRLLNAKAHIVNTRIALMKLKNDRPKIYLLVMMAAFAVLAWIGSLIDNLLLTFIMVVFVVLLPGLRKHGILQKIATAVKDLFSRLMKGTAKSEKTKAN